MVRKRQLAAETTGADSPRRHTGPMDGFVATTPDVRGPQSERKMAPVSPGSDNAGESHSGDAQVSELAQIRAELAHISARMLTKADTGSLVQEIRAALRGELADMRSDIAALENRVEEVETTAQGCQEQHRATEVAVTRQGNMLLTLRRQVEDLENRSRRNNIRVRGLPESDSDQLQVSLSALFQQLLGDQAPDTFHIERAHRALGPMRQDGSPRDAICHIASHGVKDQIMAAARVQSPIRFRGAEVALYQDLSSLTLDARRALRYAPTLSQTSMISQEMVAELCCGPCVALEVCQTDAPQRFREFCGPADPEIARHLRPKTLRAEFGKTKIKNAVHCTDLPEDAALEVQYFFKILDS
ncbi:nucleoside diphosphate kinase 7 [Pelobates cultripes]|uniref:Nucleoside diphosphate kinase 7 n=1 Tax=Pelobates cultripes TaxID=61616 RepID=A0AAD1QZL1_PELCU|nr:nucleoside diphosphate kinase 7 [Pelobates cultripes]